eukprot:TRINITY_DN6942_c0_g1_i1.p1 TRINITY_DN6942_c0_g1~~TRINITY_DN6942_c0_g1_i1.p1  ORF type:complete len:107 (-),score=10.32 TRINITY_DN6942_c0_g1_i1:112-432(-)
MLLGRHRGLPDNIDAAIAVPEKELFRAGRRKSLKNLNPSLLLQLAQHNPCHTWHATGSTLVHITSSANNGPRVTAPSATTSEVPNNLPRAQSIPDDWLAKLTKSIG